MVETVKFGKYVNKNELLTLLISSEIDFDKTGVYAYKPRHYEE
jgi:hypothetical protein